MSKTTLKNICPDTFISTLKSYPQTGKYWVAYSGGMDSSVLLHLFYSVKTEIKQAVEVIYVNHGLNELSNEWAGFCKKQCQHYDFKFSQIDIQESCPKGRSIEDWAREKRYTLIAEKIAEQDVLFTAHHQDDQVETFFLQALRGSGNHGLVCMPELKEFVKGFLARPLLQLPRSKLEGYANDNNLKWCDDESNTDIRYDRNYLRHEVLPVIEMRWPAYRETITRLVNHQKEYKILLNELAQDDMKRALHAESRNLKLDVVQTLSIERQKNLLINWLGSLGLKPPGSKHLINIISELINIDAEKSPCVNWANVEVRRYKNLLYAAEALVKSDVNRRYDWAFNDDIKFSGEILTAFSAVGKGIAKTNTENMKVQVCYRRGGEKIYPNNSSHSKTVKQLFQERAVLPWYRDQVPLIYINDELAMIPGFCTDKKFAAKQDEPSWDVKWSGYEKAIQH